MPEIVEMKTAMDGLGNAFSALQAIQSTADEQIKRNGDVSALTNIALQNVTEEMIKIEESIIELKAKGDRPPVGEEEDKTNERKSFLMDEYCRKGLAGMDPEYLKEMTVTQEEFRVKGLTESVNPTAGFLVRDEQANEIIKSVTEFSPMRQIAKVITIGSMAWEGPKRTAQFSATWVSETGSRSETPGLAYGIERIPVHELHARVDLTNALMEDSFINLEAELNMEFAERFAVAEGTAFVTGTGINRPAGFMLNTALLTASTTSKVNDLLHGDDFSSLLIGALKEPYQANATWVMNRQTLMAAMQLKDANGQYIWQPGLVAGIPGAILGRPYVLMTDIATIANGAEVLAIGDFKKGYQIVDRIGINVKRIDDVSTTESGGVAIFARKRVGAQVINAEAIKLLTIQ